MDTVFSTLPPLSGEERHYLALVSAGLDCHDRYSLTPEILLSYIRPALTARREVPYAASVPEELFCSYVLPPRVNNEWPDSSRAYLLQQLLPRVKELDILSAALEVNYWCCEQATYISTDARTMAPMGMLRRGQGRCGEESTLLTCALRSVGIPARQCYAPYWAHCDDNHAWVEFWAGDGWHFMGACEPEAQSDEGWFRSAASKALLIRSRVPDPLTEAGYRVVNSTALYGKTTLLTVTMTAEGHPVPDAEVRFQLINYSRVQTLHTAPTDAHGQVTMELGLGDLIVSTVLDGVLVEQAVDVRATRSVTLSKESGFSPEKQEQTIRWTLTPPAETIPAPPPFHEAHAVRLARCEAHRCAKQTGPSSEIDRFRALPQYTREDKELLLQTLTEKDFFDVTGQTLESFLRAALPYKNRFPLTLWQTHILAPRVEWEPLLPIRQELQSLVPADLSSIPQVLSWMEQNLKKLPEYGLTDRRGNAAAYVRNHVCPESEWDILAVQLCRALGIPAALSPQTVKLDTASAKVPLTLSTQEPLMNEEEHFSLSRWNGYDYVPIRLGGTGTHLLEPGAYSLITVRRQIDGTVSANVQRFLLREATEKWLTPEPDETAGKLIHVPLPPLSTTPVTENAPEVASRAASEPSLLAFLQPGAEPTEHLLRELLDLERPFPFPIRFLLKREADLANPTLSSVLATLPAAAAYLYLEEDRFPIQSAAGIGDARLPLTLALDEKQHILYGCANYNIRSAAKLHKILTMVR